MGHTVPYLPAGNHVLIYLWATQSVIYCRPPRPDLTCRPTRPRSTCRPPRPDLFVSNLIPDLPAGHPVLIYLWATLSLIYCRPPRPVPIYLSANPAQIYLSATRPDLPVGHTVPYLPAGHHVLTYLSATPSLFWSRPVSKTRSLSLLSSERKSHETPRPASILF